MPIRLIFFVILLNQCVFEVNFSKNNNIIIKIVLKRKKIVITHVRNEPKACENLKSA